jgi:hypothetical protein
MRDVCANFHSIHMKSGGFFMLDTRLTRLSCPFVNYRFVSNNSNNLSLQFENLIIHLPVGSCEVRNQPFNEITDDSVTSVDRAGTSIICCPRKLRKICFKLNLKGKSCFRDYKFSDLEHVCHQNHLIQFFVRSWGIN